MAYTSSFVAKPHLARPSEIDPSLHISTSSHPHSSQFSSRSPAIAMRNVSSHGRSSIISPHIARAKSDHHQRSKIFVIGTYHDTEDQGEDSDYFPESTPGHAWHKREQVLPKMRVVGFDTSSACASKSCANGQQFFVPIISDCTPLILHLLGPPSPSQLRSHPNRSALQSSITSRQSPDGRSNVPRRQSLSIQPSSDKSCISQASVSPITQHRTDLSKCNVPHASDIYQKGTVKTM